MSATSDRQPRLGVYARPFIPSSLKSVNLTPANIIPSAPAPSVDFEKYVQTFAGSRFLTTHATTSHWRRSRQLPNTDGPDPPGLRPESYQCYFHAALEQESDAQRQECEDHAPFRVSVTKTCTTDPRPSMYTLLVPGLREMSLRVEIGDLAQLRQLRFNGHGEVISGSRLRNVNGKPLKLPRLENGQHNGTVWGIDRLKGTLSLRVDSLAPRSMLFNVTFTVQHGRLDALHRAVACAQKSLEAASNDNWMRSMLFPDETDGYYQKILNKAILDLNLYDELLNYQQLKAINTVLNETYGPVPYINSGPPATGKTKTIVELASQLVSKDKTAHLLVCAPSDPAADTLVQRLGKHFKPSELLRINAPSRSFPEVPSSLLSYCFVDDGMFSIPPFEELMRCKIVVSTCRDVDTLLRARLSNTDLYSLEKKLHHAIHPNQEFEMKRLHWTGLLVDEAAQATEPEALIALSFIAPPTEHNVEREWPIFVMAGDQHQLGPRNASQNAALDVSLFERLLNRPFYRDHPLARSKQTGGIMRPLTLEMLPILRPAFTNLIQNYRSHPAILVTPSQLFYNDTLEPEATAVDALLSWSGWRGPGWPDGDRWPILLAANEAVDEIEQDGGGWYNLTEARMACRIAQSFLGVGILRKFAREAPFSVPGVSIGPLEAFQGLESRLVILCTTRTRDRFIDQDVAKGLGVIHEPKRFNVALTRAKEGLIVIGNPAVLKKDRHWRAFLAFCDRNGLSEEPSTGVSQREPQDGNQANVSRLEKRLLRNGETDDGNLVGDTDNISNGVRETGIPGRR